VSRRADYPRAGSPLISERRAGHDRLRRACANLAGFATVVAVGYLAFSFTAAWLAERIVP